MKNIGQKTIDQYLEGLKIENSNKEKIVLAITHLVYQRNQKVVQFETESDKEKGAQFLRSIDEYDQLIKDEIDKILKGEKGPTYDF
ncbi:hypothetical protein GYA54_03745 [Candidatus Kuenenbacteria bacterium]|nr:hypothetical protein [Candidatus Kuenenbacteria bacterium]